MLQLIAVFLYDLNNHIGIEPEKEHTHFLAGKRFPPLVKIHPLVNKVNQHQAHSVVTAEHFLKLFCKSWIMIHQM